MDVLKYTVITLLHTKVALSPGVMPNVPNASYWMHSNEMKDLAFPDHLSLQASAIYADVFLDFYRSKKSCYTDHQIVWSILQGYSVGETEVDN